MERLNNKIGLITGAASGIGLATCELLLQNGATIIMSDLSNSAGRQKADQFGTRASFETLDVTSEKDWINISNNIEKKYSGLDFIINNAGVGTPGSIVNISSGAGIIGAPNLAAYCSSKASVRLLTKSVALHCARKGYGIRCNSVHPSYTDTPMVDEIVSAHRNPMQYKIALEAASPMGRLGTPLDIAGAVVYLVSDEAKFVNGTEIVVDGGLTAT